ncbi:Permease of the drug/metabolite transporter (DMT) superfamily [Actinopolyspora xinjiangensis]|uniref:Permease of the drug/metabolite transporter (DMT) superfamily n=1 Tax=Actinopolyspora xinjiangensis TaxID=405564 RepID=A0A1H0QBA3_9ACTN|nr:DMT family transporter [Actinopolyspora xinjiangensis]SDP13956.1 Permease of the drug/metabolite transporter (DMT) superfamily [Actinopolyspora xinjiangensis]
MYNRANYVRLVTLALLWGASFLFIKLGLEAMSPTQVTFSRIALGAVVLVGLCLLRGLRPGGFGSPEERRLWGVIAGAAVFGNVLPWTLFGIGERTVDSGIAGVLNATTPLWTVLFGLAFGTERSVRPLQLLGLLVGFSGVVVILAPWHGSSGLLGWGVLACLGAAMSYGVGFVYMGRGLDGSGADGRRISPLTVGAMQMSAAAVLSVLLLPLGGLAPVELSPIPLLAVGVLGVFGTGFAFALHLRIVSDEGATTASTVTYLMPAVSVLLGWLVLGESLGPRVLAGMLIVLLGVALSRTNVRSGREHRDETETKSPEHARD